MNLFWVLMKTKMQTNLSTVLPSYQVVLLVVHLWGVSPHAVDGQQKVHERKWGVQPQEVGPGHKPEDKGVSSFQLFVPS